MTSTALYGEHELVALRAGITYQGHVLPADTVGTVVSVHSDHAAYTVEFGAGGQSLLPDLIHTDLKPAPHNARPA